MRAAEVAGIVAQYTCMDVMERAIDTVRAASLTPTVSFVAGGGCGRWNGGMWARVAGAGVALVWLAGHQGAPGLGLGLAHALTLPLDPLANTACRLGLALKWGAVWVACHVVNAGDPCAGNHMAADAALIGMDVMAMAAIAGATAEPALCVVGVSRRLRTAAARQHAICVEGVRRLGQGRWLLLTIAATATEWFLVLDLVWARLFHALHPTNRPDTKEVMTLGDWSGQTPSGMAVLVHGLDSDASSLALLAQILVLNGVPVAMCDYHADPAKGYMHVAQDSVDVYASICMSQVADLVQQHAAQPRPAGAPLRLVFVGCVYFESLYTPCCINSLYCTDSFLSYMRCEVTCDTERGGSQAFDGRAGRLPNGAPIAIKCARGDGGGAHNLFADGWRAVAGKFASELPQHCPLSKKREDVCALGPASHRWRVYPSRDLDLGGNGAAPCTAAARSTSFTQSSTGCGWARRHCTAKRRRRGCGECSALCMGIALQFALEQSVVRSPSACRPGYLGKGQINLRDLECVCAGICTHVPLCVGVSGCIYVFVNIQQSSGTRTES